MIDRKLETIPRLYNLSLLLGGVSFLNNHGKTHVFYFLGHQWANNPRRRRAYSMSDTLWVMKPMNFFQKAYAVMSGGYHILEDKGSKFYPKK